MVALQVLVYHAPKTPELDLEGKEGTVKLIVKKFKGKELSANLPYRVEFVLDPESEKPKKLLVHLVRCYILRVSWAILSCLPFNWLMFFCSQDASEFDMVD